MRTLLVLLWIILPGDLVVIDGDTLYQGVHKYRMKGYDTPEYFPRAKCQAEHDLAAKAKARLAELITQCGHTIKPLGTSCKYGRECVILLVGNKDIAERAVAEGWGQYWNGKSPKPDWCPAPVQLNFRPGC